MCWISYRLPHWQVEMLTKGKADVFDGSEVLYKLHAVHFSEVVLDTDLP